MIIDTADFESGVQRDTDVCIIGAGVAGISLARELTGRGLRICIVENGGFRFRPRPQTLAFGANVGNPYFALGVARIFRFGGTSNRWCSDLGDGSTGVRLRPLDPIDFERREEIAHSGWPFDYDHLAPYYHRAQAHFHLDERDYRWQSWSDLTAHTALPLDESRVKSVIFQFSETRQFIQRARQFIEQSDDIEILPFVHAVELEVGDTAQNVQRLNAVTLSGKALSISAQHFVLAGGGIENPRFLLNCNRQHSSGLGNQHDLVGRFFMEHPHLLSGTVIPSSPALFDQIGLYRTHPVDGSHIMGKLALNNDVLRREALLNSCMFFEPRPTRDPRRPRKIYNTHGAEAMLAILGDITNLRWPRQVVTRSIQVCREMPKLAAFALEKLDRRRHGGAPVAMGVYNFLEQVPNPDSRVSLTAEKDPFGQPRAKLDWKLTEQDIRSMLRSQVLLGEELERLGLGHLIPDPYEEVSPDNIIGGYHHMGTTRMHSDPKQGVVDEHCAVHGVPNLHIAGSSVFPTSGYANPTLTIAALAIRLADRLKGAFNRRVT
ncbi:MAG: GMC family oxidoreductase [Pseudomonadota bacterium]